VLKSLCIKSNNKNVNDYLFQKFCQLSLDNIYVSNYNFKLYTNIIVHYTGIDLNSFLHEVSSILSDTIINFYETKKLKQIINSNYFYFSEIEQAQILDICKEHLLNVEPEELAIKKESISLAIIDYFSSNKSLILDGFCDFRLTEYIKILDSLVDISVNKFVIDREYTEFIDLLKVYINSKDYGSDIIHLVYNSGESILLDKYKNVINLDNHILDSKYLSDITFSSNDYALNTLLTLLPKVIYIHVIDIEDEFINTLKLIFDTRVYLCHDCSLCKIYKLEKIKR